MKTEITLVKQSDKSTVLTYSTTIIPTIGDSLVVSGSELFLVKARILPTIDNGRVVLIGIII